MLYELFMIWIVGSISVIAASMVFGGLLCVWCAYKGRKRSRLASNFTQLSHPLPTDRYSSSALPLTACY